ncbi:MAG: DNA adenine methylase [Phycisphaerales bacterium]
MIKYLGSKRRLLPTILDLVERATARPPGTAIDLFSGTSRVGHALKARGWRVLANDHNAYAHTLATCYVQADAQDVLADAQGVLDELRTLPGRPGYFTQTFCERSRFVHPRNGERIDAIRSRIETMGLEPELKAVVLTSLVEAADRVDSTTGVQMAYLKAWAPRALNALELRVPSVLPRAGVGKGVALGMDALDGARAFAEIEPDVDVAYLDPPYNQHSYLGNYHVWETLVRWDAPEVYGVACKRVDCRERRSRFNSKAGIAPALAEVIGAVRARTLIVSFSDEGRLTREQVAALLADRFGEAPVVVEREDRRYVGAQIGIYNPSGERVGRVKHLHNREFLFVAGEGARAIEGLEIAA